MSKIYEYFGLEFFLYGNDHLPIHVHVKYGNDKTVYEIFGNDAIKVRSCMFLFASVSDVPEFKQLIRKYGWK